MAGGPRVGVVLMGGCPTSGGDGPMSSRPAELKARLSSNLSLRVYCHVMVVAPERPEASWTRQGNGCRCRGAAHLPREPLT